MRPEQYLLILWARKYTLLVTLAVVVGVTALGSWLWPKSYTATATLVLDVKTSDPLTGALTPNSLPMPAFVATQAEIIGSRRVAHKVVDALKLADNPVAKQQFRDATEGRGDIRDWLAERLIQDLRIAPGRDTSLVDVGYKGSDPEFAAALANAFANAYVQTHAEVKAEPGRQNAEWFDRENRELRENLEKARTRLSEFQKAKGYIASEERLDIESQRLAELTTQLTAAQGQTYDAQSRDSQTKASGVDTAPDVLTNALIQSLKSDLGRQEAKLSELTSRVGRNHPQYETALAETESLRARLRQEMARVAAGMGNSLRIAQKRETEVRSAITKHKERIFELKNIRDEAAVLQREVENAQKVYDNAIMRLNQTRLEGRSNVTNVVLLNAAVAPIDPSSPRMLRNLLIAVVLGTILATAIAMTRELFDRRVRSEADLAEDLDIPVLGRLGAVKLKQKRRFTLWREGWPRRRAANGPWRHEPA